jgi:hypothetical protein
MTISNAIGARAKAFKRKPAVAPISALADSKTRAISMLDANGDCCPWQEGWPIDGICDMEVAG